VDESDDERRQRRQETLAAIERVKPSNNPTPEDIARLHELHARHEREAGRYEQAALAEERARHARAKMKRASPPDETGTSD